MHVGPQASQPSRKPARWAPRVTTTPRERLVVYLFMLTMHGVPIAGLLWGSPDRSTWIALVVLYLTGSLGVIVGLHRYFAHHAFKTSRLFQFALALLGASTFSEPIGFAGKHRLHHRYSDERRDVHGPGFGWWHSWIGSMVDDGYSREEIFRAAADLHAFPELVFLFRYNWVVGATTGALVWLLGGFEMFALGFCLSRALIIHAVSSVNYFGHGWGYQRFPSNDQSTNHPLLGLLTFGEGWHNNHHFFPPAARAGYRWWELDLWYLCIRLFAALGLVWEIRTIPAHMRTRERRLRFRDLWGRRAP
ncbi:MAG: acyl-CoA desaturase [Myxococcales bacterium]|nr:acyl-CoA desaturase [Myxococcales bacterium]